LKDKGWLTPYEELAAAAGRMAEGEGHEQTVKVQQDLIVKVEENRNGMAKLIEEAVAKHNHEYGKWLIDTVKTILQKDNHIDDARRLANPGPT
jgi:predicted ATPase